MSFKKKAEKIINEFGGFYLPLELEIPEKCFEEAKDVFDEGFFVRHDPSLPGHEEGKGWSSSCLHGLGWDKVVSSHAYGYKGNYGDHGVPMDWTEVALMCPETTRFFRDVFPVKQGGQMYKRLRFMLLEPEGFIPSHFDETVYGKGNILKSVTIPLNNPDGCYLKNDDTNQIIPFEPFKTMLVDNSINHSGENRSSENRFHILVQKNNDWRDDFWKLFVESFEKNYDGNLK